jgi:phosphinothricin acetyltransferase
MSSEVYSSASPPRLDTIVRAAARDDVSAISAIYNQAVEHTTASWDWTPELLETRLAWFDDKVAGGWPVVVAEDASGVVGWGSYGPFRTKDGYAQTVEHSVYVDLGRRGAGIGSALLVPLIQRARADGHHVMIGGVSADNLGSVAFHQRHGFVEVARFSEVGRKFDRWLDLVFLQLTL